jgi:hypothetical protein
MYLNALEFLDEEREAWRPFEALADLADDRLEASAPDAHDWSARDLMGHLLAWQEVALAVARELAVSETSPAKAAADSDWESRGGEVINAEIQARYRELLVDELKQRFRSVPGELRGTLTVVPETRWVKNSDHLRFFMDQTVDHYADHEADLAAILTAAAPS